MRPITLRQIHNYLGLFIAPSILFFALTGCLQIFNLHEAHGDYIPPLILAKLASVHKDQVLTVHEHHHDAEPAAAASSAQAEPPKHDDDDEGTTLSTLILKWFFCIVALGLVTSTCLGLWIGLRGPRNRALGWTCVIAGALIPVLLLVI